MTVPAHRVVLLVLDDHGLAAAAVDLEVEERVPLGQHGAQAPAVDLERHGVAVDAVDDAGHEALPPKPAAGPRPALLAGLDGQHCSLTLCHGGGLYSGPEPRPDGPPRSALRGGT